MFIPSAGKATRSPSPARTKWAPATVFARLPHAPRAALDRPYPGGPGKASLLPPLGALVVADDVLGRDRPLRLPTEEEGAARRVDRERLGHQPVQVAEPEEGELRRLAGRARAEQALGEEID